MNIFSIFTTPFKGRLPENLPASFVNLLPKDVKCLVIKYLIKKSSVTTTMLVSKEWKELTYDIIRLNPVLDNFFWIKLNYLQKNSEELRKALVEIDHCEDIRPLVTSLALQKIKFFNEDNSPILEVLLKNEPIKIPRNDLIYKNYSYFFIHRKLLKILVENKIIILNHDNLNCAIKLQDVEMICKFLKEKQDQSIAVKPNDFKLAYKTNNEELVQVFIEFFPHSKAEWASYKGDIETVELHLNDPSFSVSTNNYLILELAVEQGHTEIVRKIIEKRTIPLACCTHLQFVAYRKNHIDILTLLTQKAPINKDILFYKKISKQIDGIDFLLKNLNIDPVDIASAIRLRSSFFEDNEEIFKALAQKLPHPYNDFILAIYKGDQPSVKRALQDQNVNPTDLHYLAFLITAKKGHLEIIQLLLEDKRVDLKESYGIILREASACGHLAVVKWILKNRLTYITTEVGHNAFDKAGRKGHVEIMKLISEALPWSVGSFFYNWVFDQKTPIINSILFDKKKLLCSSISDKEIAVIKFLLEDKKLKIEDEHYYKLTLLAREYPHQGLLPLLKWHSRGRSMWNYKINTRE